MKNRGQICKYKEEEKWEKELTEWEKEKEKERERVGDFLVIVLIDVYVLLYIKWVLVRDSWWMVMERCSHWGCEGGNRRK